MLSVWRCSPERRKRSSGPSLMNRSRRNMQISELPEMLEYPPSALFKAAAGGGRRYWRHGVTSPDGKVRTLRVPDRQLMELQKRIHQRLLRPIAINGSVHSAGGRNPLTNARVHMQHPFLSVFDIESCFPSIGPHRVCRALE